MNLGVYPIAIALWLIDSPVDHVYAEMGNLYHKLEAEDHASLFIRFRMIVSPPFMQATP
ncbi:hypothetical protein J7K07_00495 [Candidatus Bathyarchaeota archaeon]|nr:hypothetical protein [Candidatus Bathyarchaeota archaeon]